MAGGVLATLSDPALNGPFALLNLPNLVLLPGNTVRLHASHLPLELGSGMTLCCVEELHHREHPGARVCLAEVQQVQRSPTGIAFTLLGLRRFLPKVQLETDRGTQLLGQAEAFSPWPGGTLPQFSDLRPDVAALRSRVDPSLWLDMVAFHRPLSVHQRWLLLQEPNPRSRARQLSGFPSLEQRTVTHSLN